MALGPVGFSAAGVLALAGARAIEALAADASRNWSVERDVKEQYR